jgi:hypothetical protein
LFFHLVYFLKNLFQSDDRALFIFREGLVQKWLRRMDPPEFFGRQATSLSHLLDSESKREFVRATWMPPHADW